MIGLRRLGPLLAPCILLLILLTTVRAGSVDHNPCGDGFRSIGRASSDSNHERTRQNIAEARYVDGPLPEVRVDAKGRPTINGGVITDDSQYPLELVMKNLVLSEVELSRLPRNARILSVGEGRGNLASTLRRRFPNTRALDVWYGGKDLPHELQSYVARNGDHLIAGSSTNIRVPSETVDLVLSHMLLNNLPNSAAIARSLHEMIRILKVGGEARIAFGTSLGDRYLQMLKAAYGDEISISSTNWRSKWGGRMEDHDGVTLMIRRNHSAPTFPDSESKSGVQL